LIRHLVACAIILLSPVAQRIERQPSKLRVVGSNPTGTTKPESFQESMRRWQEFKATGYSHHCIRPRSGIESKLKHKAANGQWPKASRTIAADPRIPFGTKLLVAYNGKILEFTVEDRGRSIKGKRIDIFYRTCGEAIELGHKSMYVTSLQWLTKN
jgi:3D (Asp-Asp-Asp) domain-containing protein